MTFDPDFRFYTEDPQVRPQLPRDEVYAEIDAELQRRRDAYPKLVSKGRMARVDADRELRVWSRLRDGERVDDAVPPTGATANWVELVHALRREIALRRQHYPQLIAKGRLTPGRPRAGWR